MSSKTYISAADTAKLVRKALADAFPGQKFSVTTKSYSMGASITVRWMDGPTSKQVDEVVGQYEGATFDGMIDLKSYVTHTDPKTGEQIRYGADYIHTNRDYSRALLEQVGKQFTADWGLPTPEIREHNDHSAYYVEDYGQIINGGQRFQTTAWQCNRMLQETSAYVKPRSAIKYPDAPMLSPNQPKRNSIQADEPKPAPSISDFKGKPVIAIPLENGEEFKFGKAKAKALLKYLKEIEEFAKD